MPGAQMRMRGGYCRTDVLSQPPALSMHSSGRYLLLDGQPWLANTAAGSWFAIQAISNTDSSSYVDTLSAAGFNAISVSLIANDTLRYSTTSGNHFAAPNWNNGSTVAPFTTPGNFATFNPTYGAHALERVTYMLSKGLVPLMTLCYPGFNGETGTSQQGWAGEMTADTNAHMLTYGAAAETLFAGIQKLAWVIGGDVPLTLGGTLEARSLAAVTGVQSVNANRIWMAHLGGSNTGVLPYEQTNIGAIPGMVWSKYQYADGGDGADGDTASWWRTEQSWLHSPSRPAFVLDPGYEGDPGEPGNPYFLHRRTHQDMCAGACGMAYARGDDGDGLPWYGSATASWTTTKPGLADHIVAYNFWKLQPWWQMSPDTGNVYVTAGRGTHASNSYGYICVRASPTKLIAYFPNAAAATITADMSQLSGYGSTIPGKWIDPTTGSSTPVSGSPFATSGTHNFTQPGANASGSLTDWLLVLG